MTADRATGVQPMGFQDQLARAATVLVESSRHRPGPGGPMVDAYAVVTGRTLEDVAADIALTKIRPQPW